MKLTLIGVAAVAAAAFVTPAIAQAVIEDPGLCAQFYPNANCQNYGPGNPYTSDYQARLYGNSYAGIRPHHSWRHARVHRRH